MQSNKAIPYTAPVIYPHGTFFRKGERIYVTCKAQKLLWPAGVELDLSQGLEIRKDQDGTIYASARIKGWNEYC